MTALASADVRRARRTTAQVPEHGIASPRPGAAPRRAARLVPLVLTSHTLRACREPFEYAKEI